MRSVKLDEVIRNATCQVFGWEDASNDAQRIVVARLAESFPSPDTLVLCEPSLARSTKRPPDVVLIDPAVGVHVFEVKGHALSGVESLAPGGQMRFRYDTGAQTRSPIAQVRAAMFDIKNAAEQRCASDFVLPLKYWVLFPNIQREAWLNRWGEQAYAPPELLFGDQLASLSQMLQSVAARLRANAGCERWPEDQLAAVRLAFGDTSVLYPRPEERASRRVDEGTLGEVFDEAATQYKALSRDQQTLSEQVWAEGPRLIRGVAGSGKTIVLANNLARRLARAKRERSLFDDEPLRILALCHNRSLVPFLQRKIDLAHEQRTGKPLPDKGLEIISYNRLLYKLSRDGLWRYQKIEEATDEERATRYLAELLAAKKSQPQLVESLSYDAIYVDEGQDFQETDFLILKELCRSVGDHSPSLYIFYDDAQNFLGRKRPNWSTLGLNVRGRSFVMTQCFRNTRPIVEAAFNVLYGGCAEAGQDLPTQAFGDLSTLKEKHAIVREDDGFWRIAFAVREGLPARLELAPNAAEETRQIVARVRWLVEVQRVRPQDILVLGFSRSRIEAIAQAIGEAAIRGIERLHVSFREQDQLLGARGQLSLSTTASAKGYDAYCVLLASGNEFPRDAAGRISFYVGCTRAIEYLEVFAYRQEGLVSEFERILRRQKEITGD